MNQADVMAEIADVLGDLPGIRKAHPHPVKSVGASPAVVVGYAKTTYAIESEGGADRLALSVWVVIGDVVADATAEKVGAYAGRGDDRSVIDALESKTDWTTCDYVTVAAQDFDGVVVADKDHLAVTFDLDVVVSND